MSTTIVSNGFTSTGLTAGAGDEIDVKSGGTTVSTTVSGGGFENVSGTANYTTISSGGNQVVSGLGAAANHTIVGNAGSQVVSNGGIASYAIVSGGGTQTVLGGAVNGTQVSFGGSELVFSGLATFTTVSSGGAEYVQGSGAVTSGDSLLNGGEEDVIAGGVVLNTQIQDGGVETISFGGTAISATVYAGGFQVVSSGGTASGTVVSSGGVLSFFSGSTVTGAVVLDGGALDLADVAYDNAGTADIDSSTDVLTIHEGGKDYVEQLGGNYTGEYFRLADDGYGGTIVTEDGTPCYCRDTRILTDSGEVAVQHLRIGDRLMTASGAARPIRWIGVRSYSGRFAAGNRDVLPILIRQGALDGNVPRRDLWVSPMHAMYLEGVLIPAHVLVNGVSITQAAQVEQVQYFHLELETHDVIVAEGALSESFLDDGSRGMFDNAFMYRSMYPGAVASPARYCAPCVDDGAIVQAVRDQIAALFADRAAA